MARTSTIKVEVLGDSKNLERAFDRAGKAGQRFSVGIGTLVKSAVVFEAVGKAIEGLSATVHLGIEEFADHARVAAQTAAAIKSTGDVSGATAKHIEELGLKMSNLSGIDDELVQKGENVLLSFTNIRNSVGKGNNIFDRATKAVTDFAARTGKDVPLAALQLGKALQDPIGKVAALSRAGIVFTKQQRDQIKALVETKGVIAGQNQILKLLEERYGGAAAAAGKTLPGQLNILRDRFKDLSGTIVGVFAPAFAKGVASLTTFVRQISAAKGIHAKLTIIWDGVEQAGRDLLAKFESIDFKGIATAIASQAEKEFDKIDWRGLAGRLGGRARREIGRLGDFLGGVDFAQVGRTIGDRVGAALSKAGDLIGRVDWQKVGRKTIDGLVGAFVVVADVVVHALPGIFRGMFHLAVSALEASGNILLGAGKELGKLLLRGIVAGARSIGKELEKLGLELVLKIIKPFDVSVFGVHLIPGLHSLIGSVEKQLDSLTVTAQRTADAVAAAVGGKPAGSINRSAAFAPSEKSDGAAKFAVAPPGPGAVVDKTFTLPFKLRLAEAEAAATAAAGDDIKIARDIRAFVLKAIPKLHGEKLIGAYTELGRVNQQIADFVKKAADAAKAFLVPLALQVQQARAEALGQDTTTKSVLEKIKKTAQAALKSGRLGLQGQLDAWNTIKSVNDQLKNFGNETKFKLADLSKLSAGLGLTGEDRKRLQARLSQLGPGGTVPAGSSSARSPQSVGGGDIVVHTHVKLDGREVAVNTTRHQQKRARRNPPQKRGQFAGANP